MFVRDREAGPDSRTSAASLLESFEETLPLDPDHSAEAHDSL